MYFACRFEGKLFPHVDSDELSCDTQQKSLHRELSSYLAPDKALDGDAIMKDCFPTITEADLFISHSHKDRKIAIQLANILWGCCGIHSFIDSMVWDYADDLLRDIDEQYSLFDGKWAKFDYKKRNVSTSYVHMMLAHALMKMMDKCYGIIFINTPNSIAPSNIGKSGTTFSPWIFYELSMLQFLRIKKPGVICENFGQQKTASMTPLQIHLPTKIEELPILTYEHVVEVCKCIASADMPDANTKRAEAMEYLSKLVCPRSAKNTPTAPAR